MLLANRLRADVLSISKLGTGQQQYYLDAVARGVEDYYAGAGEAPGEWIGAASVELGLLGQVEPVDLHAVLSGLDPATLVSLVRGNQKVPGFDLTFSAPKSVSVLWALADDRAVVRTIRDAHDAAVRAAIGWLEEEACVGRRGRNGLRLTKGSGFVAAGFRHRTSRTGDPQLHTHVLLANLVRGEDGRWSALDARQLYARVKTAGALYRSELRHRLTQELGVSWTAGDRGMSEIEGIPPRVLREFSQRRREIEQALAERGIGGAKAAQVAALDTRWTKSHAVDDATLAARWRERAEGLRFGPGRLTQVLDTRRREVDALTHAELARQLVESDSSFTKGDVLQALAADARHGMPIQELDRRADAFLARDEVVDLAPTPTGPRYSTREHLALERRVLGMAVAARGAGIAVVDQADVSSHVSEQTSHRLLSGEQERMVRQLTRSGNGVDVVVGVAGSGKTTALAVAHRAWADAGVRVIGTALSARAAAELQAGSGIPSVTLASFLLAAEAGPYRLPAGSVIVVDEAGMVGTRDLARVLDIGARDRAKVVLVGDHRQLPEIAAGGAFATLAAELDAVVLEENHRQSDRRHRRTLRRLRHGNPVRALDDLKGRGDLVTVEDRRSLLARVAADYEHAMTAGADVLVLSTRRAVVRHLNGAIRELLRERGELGPDVAHFGDTGFAIGDRVIALRNDRRLGVRNGDRGIVTGVHQGPMSADVSLAVSLTGGRRVLLPGAYLAAGHLDHAYATTIHKAQGATVDIALVVADHAMTREAAYVGLSRGRHSNRLYATRTDLADDHVLESRHGRNTWNLLARLQRRAAKQLAIDLLPGPEVGR